MARHILFCPVVCYATLVGLLSFGVASDARVLNGTLSPGAVLTVCTSPFDPYVQCTPGLVPTDASGERLKLCPPSLVFPDYARPFNVNSGSFIGFSIAAASLRSRMICTSCLCLQLPCCCQHVRCWAFPHLRSSLNSGASQGMHILHTHTIQLKVTIFPGVRHPPLQFGTCKFAPPFLGFSVLPHTLCTHTDRQLFTN
jgi:hypothetical protein